MVNSSCNRLKVCPCSYIYFLSPEKDLPTIKICAIALIIIDVYAIIINMVLKHNTIELNL